MGVWFDGVWFCSVPCLRQYAAHALETADAPEAPPPPAIPPLGTVLVQQKAVSREIVHAALREQRESGQRLGAQLRAMGALTGEDLLRALAAQAGVGYLTTLDPARVRTGQAGLSREAVLTLGVVPFDCRPQSELLRVACTAPVPRHALRALREMTGYVVEPFLVSDELFDTLVDAYGAAQAVPAPTGAVRTLSDAVRRVTAAAQEGRAARMVRARFDPFVWVRLEGQTGTEDFVLPLPRHTEEGTTWLAAPTSL
jgi:type IV pilus assembly protein PilB